MFQIDAGCCKTLTVCEKSRTAENIQKEYLESSSCGTCFLAPCLTAEHPDPSVILHVPCATGEAISGVPEDRQTGDEQSYNHKREH